MQYQTAQTGSAPGDEQLLVSRAQDGDSGAFAELYDGYATRVYRFVYYRTGHKETAEDLTSVIFTKAYQKIAGFKSDKGVFGAWLFKIARNTVIDHMRTKKTTLDLDEAFNITSGDDIAKQAELNDQLERVKGFLNQLDETQKDIVVMRLWDNLPYSEIASVVGKTEGNCKVIFSRAVQKIRKELVPIISAIATLLILQ